MLRPLQRLIVLSSVAAILFSGGCCLCHHKKKKSRGCDCDTLGCPTPPANRVNEDEKCKAKKKWNAWVDSTVNDDGCSPGKERVPILKRIADKANMESDIPIIKAAAKLKHQEEMCEQKIKAVKYLGTLGCSCYDKNGDVSDALLEATSDCLPAVRLAAVQAIGGCVCGVAYPRTCCTDEIAERLSEMAGGIDDKGCFVEPEPQIRQWAAYVSQYCPKKLKPALQPEEVGPAPKERDPSPIETDQNSNLPAPDPMPQPRALVEPQTSRRAVTQQLVVVAEPDTDDDENFEFMADALFHQPMLMFARPQHEATCQLVANVAMPDSIVENVTPTAIYVTGEMTETADDFPPPATPESTLQNQIGAASDERVDKPSMQAPERTAPIVQPEFTRPVASVDANVSQPAIPRPVATPQNVPSKSKPVTRKFERSSYRGTSQGQVETVDLSAETAVIRLDQLVAVPEGSRVHVVHKYALGRVQAIGEFEITASGLGVAEIRAIAGTSMRKISVGDTVKVFCE